MSFYLPACCGWFQQTIQDLCLGIQKSQSVICLQIARNLHEKVSDKKVCECFTRHLNKVELGSDLQASIITKQCGVFDSDKKPRAISATSFSIVCRY